MGGEVFPTGLHRSDLGLSCESGQALAEAVRAVPGPSPAPTST